MLALSAVAGWTGTAGLRNLLGDVAQLCSCSSGWPGPYKLMAPRLLTSTESWNDSMLAAPQSAARRAKWASVIPTSMHAKSKPKFTKAHSFGLVTGSSRYCHEAHNSSLNDQ